MTEHGRDIGILFADLSGSMKLYDAFGNRGALAAIATCCNGIAAVVRHHGGQVVKTIGDEVMAAFSDVGAMCAAAQAMQAQIEAMAPLQAAAGPIKLGLRIGFTYGPAIESEGDFYGETVNVAARMVQLAKRAQILTTGECEQRLDPTSRPATRRLDWLPVKGKPDGVNVVEVLWREDKPGHVTVISLSGPAGATPTGSQLRLVLAGRTWLCDNACHSLTIGREASNNIVLSNAAASRNHATIERRRDRWLLVDHSSNGTFLLSPTRDIHLRHEEIILEGGGSLGFGHSVRSNLDYVAEFSIEPVRDAAPARDQLDGLDVVSDA